MPTSERDPPTPAEQVLPVGDRQLERIQPDQALTVRIRPTDGAESGEPIAVRVLDLSLHGLLLTKVPEAVQGTLIDIYDLEPQPVRARVVRQSDLGTHISFVDHLHPRYGAGSPRKP